MQRKDGENREKNEILMIARKEARSFSALDIPAGDFLGALPNSKGETNYYYLLDGEYRYDCDAVRRWREQRTKEAERRKSERRKTERKKALEKERKLYG